MHASTACVRSLGGTFEVTPLAMAGYARPWETTAITVSSVKLAIVELVNLADKVNLRSCEIQD